MLVETLELRELFISAVPTNFPLTETEEDKLADPDVSFTPTLRVVPAHAIEDVDPISTNPSELKLADPIVREAATRSDTDVEVIDAEQLSEDKEAILTIPDTEVEMLDDKED